MSVQVPLVEQSPEELLSDPLVRLSPGGREQIELDAEVTPVSEELRVIAIYDFLRGNSFGFGLDGNRRPVHVRARHHEHLVAYGAVVTRKNVRWQVGTCDVAQVQRALRVGPRNSNEDMLGIGDGAHERPDGSAGREAGIDQKRARFPAVWYQRIPKIQWSQDLINCEIWGVRTALLPQHGGAKGGHGHGPQDR